MIGVNQSLKIKSSETGHLQQVPDNWRIKKLKFTTFHRIEKSIRVSGLPYIGLENVESGTGKLISVSDEMDDSDAKKFLKGDVLFGKLRPYLAKVLLCDFHGRCSGEFLVLKTKEYDAGFLKLLLLSSGFIELVNSSTYGSKMPRAEWEFIGNIKLPIPPMDLQKNIFSIVSKEIERIERYSALIKRLITLLEEKEQALVKNAVTKGLYRGVPMRDSGILWIGKIPKDWELRRLKFNHSKVIGGQSPSSSSYSDNHGFPFIQGSEEFGAIHPKPKIKTLEVTKVVNAGSVLVSVRAPVGELNIADSEICIGRGIAGIESKTDRMDSKFLYYFLRGTISQLQSFSRGTTYGSIRIEDLENQLTVKCALKEQKEIREFLDKQTEKINSQIKLMKISIELMKERRQALISGAVSGKIESITGDAKKL